MKAGRLPAAAAILAAVVLVRPFAAAPASAIQDPPTFRAEASAIAVDVNVRNRAGRPITGLTAADFEVYDSGVLQQVDEVVYGKLPIDVTVALDISYSVTGGLLERLRDATVAVMRDLGREDRLKLMLFNMRVARTIDFTTDVKVVERAITQASAGGGTALLDAISVALVSPAEPDRRQLAVFFTDGSDSVSTTTPVVLQRIAQRTRATLAFVMPGATAVQIPGRATIANAPGVSIPLPGVTMTVSPRQTVFSTLAVETGGSVVPVGSSVAATFRRVLSDFRTTYVLYYRPRGVDRAGYHTISVTVKRDGAQVRARRGYFGS